MRRPAKLLYTIPNFISAGSQLEMLRLIQRLDRSVFEPSIAVLRRGGRLEAEIERLGIPLIETGFTVAPLPRMSALGRCRAAAAPLRPYGFDLWHSYHYSDDYTEPVVARMAGARGWIYTKKNMGWKSHGWKLRSLLATRVIARNTTMMTDFFDKPYFKSKVTLIPCGVETREFQPGEPARLNLRGSLNLPPEAILVGCVAHLVSVKGHPDLIRAIARIPNVHALLAGSLTDAAYVAEIWALAATLGIESRVHILGPVSDIPALHAELDIFALPTKESGRGEGFGVALIEAMACGVPCISTRIHGPKDIIEQGRSGLLVTPENVSELESAIRELVDNPERRKALGQGARDRVMAEYTIEMEVERTQALYRDILNLNAPA